MTEFTLYDKWQCAKREAWLRKRQIAKMTELNGGVVDDERLSQKQIRLACMESIADDYYRQWQQNGGEVPDNAQAMWRVW